MKVELILVGILLMSSIVLAREIVTPYPEPEVTPSPIEPIISVPDDIHIDSHNFDIDGHHLTHKKIGNLYITQVNSCMSMIIGKELDGKYYKRVNNLYVQVSSEWEILNFDRIYKEIK